MAEPRCIERQIWGWGRYPKSDGHLYRPERVSSLESVRTQAAEESLIGRGLGRSYGDASLNQGRGVVLFERLNRFLSFDAQAGTLACEGGVSFEDILKVFLKRGWFPPVTPGTKYVTVGGAVACDVHGKNHHRDGSLASHLKGLEILTARGDRLRCSPSRDSDVLQATVGGMGLTGFILRATLKLLPVSSAYLQVEQRRCRDLEETMQALLEFDQVHRYTVAWMDVLARGRSLGRGIVMGGDHVGPDALKASHRSAPFEVRAPLGFGVPFDFPSIVLNRWSIGLFNKLYYHLNSTSERIVDYNSFFYPLDAIGNWNRLYGKRGFLQYQCLFPTESAEKGLSALLNCFAEAGLASFLAVLKRFGPEAGPLSFPAPGYTLSLDIPWGGPRRLQVLEAADRIVIESGGRVYLAKDSRLSPRSFRRMYPRYEEWRRVKRRLDPENVFSSDLSRRLEIDGGGA